MKFTAEMSIKSGKGIFYTRNETKDETRCTGRDWREFKKFHEMIEKYMPEIGEGETMASQAVTAMNNLVYGWYNNGDVFDNQRNPLGWCNDLSCYANWLRRYGLYCLDKILHKCVTPEEYEEMLYEAAEIVLDEERLKWLERYHAAGSIYEAKGMYKCVEEEDDEDDWYV